MKILKLFGVILCLIMVYLTTIIFFPVLSVTKQPINTDIIQNKTSVSREDIEFAVDGLKLKGWLYQPEDAPGPVPCIVLTQGFCGTKDMFLEKYALRFVKAGYAALTFDYRYFGESQGEPRQLYSETEQLKDIKAAIEFARSSDKIDPDKIVVWGTSSSGHFGVIMAAEDSNIACVIGQSPVLDPEVYGKRVVKRDGIGWLLKLIVHAQRDKGRSRFGLSPHRFPAVGRPGTTAMHIAPGFYEGYQKIVRHSKTFKNEVCARIMFSPHGPDLFSAAQKVECPVLFNVCEKDINQGPDSYKKIAEILDTKVKIVKYPIGHFDIYFGENFEKAINDQIVFLKNNLGK